jgi:hypothetical protein
MELYLQSCHLDAIVRNEARGQIYELVVKNVIFWIMTQCSLTFSLHLHPEDGGIMFFRSICNDLPDYTGQHPRRHLS